MEHLYQRIHRLVDEWRLADYSVDDYPAIGEILEFAGETETGERRFLRKPQLRALETYWYLRLVRGTPHVRDLYEELFPSRSELVTALGVSETAFKETDFDLHVLWRRLAEDDDFVRRHKLQTTRESLELDYPSYILALAMGAGKTVLIGGIIATEFAMAIEYPTGPFVQNALVFAPGKTIITALRELSDVPYDRILPPRLHKPFAASLKLTFTRDGDPDIPVVPGSLFNAVVTNTEKIRIRSETVRKSDLGQLKLEGVGLDEARREVANRRLQAIAGLPHLAVFSDEAHHTYGQTLEKGLKKVRLTVDYLADKTNVVCVVNTTGTPYFKRQPLRDVVIWYSLAQGIADDILKDVSGNIHSYEFDEADESFVRHVVQDFFATYGDVHLPNGAPAKLAMYFPQTDDLEALRPAIDEAMLSMGLAPSEVLVNTSDRTLTSQADIDAFERLNDPASPYRLILLVNKGTEGWNCPSLFGCALARKLKSSKNFVLQAASRCLRQVPGNDHKARIYLSADNYGVLDKQLAETYGETIEDLDRRTRERRHERLVLRKPHVPPIALKRLQRRVVRRENSGSELSLSRPQEDTRRLVERRYGFGEGLLGRRALQQVSDALEIDTMPKGLSAYQVAAEIAGTYNLDVWDVYDELRRLYGNEDVSADDFEQLSEEVEGQLADYELEEEEVEAALALVKPDGFQVETDQAGQPVYTTEIVVPTRTELLVSLKDWMVQTPKGLGFHYDPYGFDSLPERDFFHQALEILKFKADEIEDIYFTGGITDPAKTDFWVEYQDAKGKWRRYTPDFVIRKKAKKGEPPGSGKILIVEVKGEQFASNRKATALERLEELNPDRIKYEIILTSKEKVPSDRMRVVREFVGLEDNPDGRYLRIPVNRDEVEGFCRRWKIREFSFFGSVLTPDFGPDSDVDVLVSFESDVEWSLFDVAKMEEELTRIIGREVQIVERSAVESSHNWIRRRSILESAELYLVKG